MELRRHYEIETQIDNALRFADQIGKLEIEAPFENKRTLAQAKLIQIKQVDDLSQARQILSDGVPQTNLNEDTKINRVRQWLNGWSSEWV